MPSVRNFDGHDHVLPGQSMQQGRLFEPVIIHGNRVPRGWPA
jgi:hypothetical protein